ncbi:MAG: hypothetical protein PVG62_18205, partial [Desulfobacterales bacterium]
MPEKMLMMRYNPQGPHGEPMLRKAKKVTGTPDRDSGSSPAAGTEISGETLRLYFAQFSILRFEIL